MDLRYHPEPNDTLVSIFGDSYVKRLVECDDGMILPIFLKTEPVKAKSKIHKAMREEKKTYIYRFTDRSGESGVFETKEPIEFTCDGRIWSLFKAEKWEGNTLTETLDLTDWIDYSWETPKKNHRDMTAKDSVVEPDYYKSDSGFEVADVIDAFKLNFNLGNIVKYTIREKEDKLQDLRKARWYIDREIQRIERTERLMGGE